MTLYPSGLLRDHPKMRSEEEVIRAIAAKRGTALSPKRVEPPSGVSSAAPLPSHIARGAEP